MRFPTLLAALFLITALSAAWGAQEILTNGSFESGMSAWTANGSYSVSVAPSYGGVSPAHGGKLLALAGPANVGCSYASVVSQARSAPFGSGIPTDNFVVYLYASTYLHTSDGRNVSYALMLEPGYGLVTSLFHGGPQDAWGVSQTSGYYTAHDPFDSTAPVKPITAWLELRDPLGQGEYLLLDNVRLLYDGAGIPEPSGFAALCAGLGLFIAKTRKQESTK